MAGRREERGLQRMLSLVWRDGDCEKAAVQAPRLQGAAPPSPGAAHPTGGGMKQKGPEKEQGEFPTNTEDLAARPGTAGPREADAGTGLIP